MSGRALSRLKCYLACDVNSSVLRANIRALAAMPVAGTAAEVYKLFSAHEIALSVFHDFELDNNPSPQRMSVFRRRLSVRSQCSLSETFATIQSILASDRFADQCLAELKVLTKDFPACHSEHDARHDDIMVLEVASGLYAQHLCVLMYFHAVNVAARSDDWLLVRAPYWAFCEFHKLLLNVAPLDGPPSTFDAIIDLRGVWPCPPTPVLSAALKLWEPELPDSCYRSFGKAIAAAELLV